MSVKRTQRYRTADAHPSAPRTRSKKRGGLCGQRCFLRLAGQAGLTSSLVQLLATWSQGRFESRGAKRSLRSFAASCTLFGISRAPLAAHKSWWI